MQMNIRVADFIALFLKKKGIKNIFMLTGYGVMYLNDAIKISGIKYYATRNEATAPIMAESYARLKNEVGVACVTAGPGATIALPEMLRRGYDKRMITGVVQAGSSLGILVPPSVVMVLYGMIARQPVSKLWLAGIIPGLMMATLFILYIAIRCRLQPNLGPTLPKEEREIPFREKLVLLKAGLIPFAIFKEALFVGFFLVKFALFISVSFKVSDLLFMF